MNRLLQVLRAGRAQEQRVPRSRATLPEKVPGVTGASLCPGQPPHLATMCFAPCSQGQRLHLQLGARAKGAWAVPLGHVACVRMDAGKFSLRLECYAQVGLAS